MRSAGELADIKQRQRAARDLLRAAIRIAVERRQQARRIERRRGADRDRHRAGAGHEIGEHVARQRQAFALGERLDRAARQNLRRRPHRERVAALERKSAGPLTLTLNAADAGGGGRERHRERRRAPWRAASASASRVAGKRIGTASTRDGVVAGRAFDIVEIEMNAGAVAGQQEARQRRRQHDRIAHGRHRRWRGRLCPCSRPPP